jgi:glycosyltransferase involved in cell wall biosynthesis
VIVSPMIKENHFSVCLITSSAVNESFGGTQNFVLQFSQWLTNKSVKVIVVSNSFEAFVKSVFFKDPNCLIEVKRKRFALLKHVPFLLPSFMFAVMSFLEIIRRNKEFSFAVIHSQDVFISGFVGMLAHKLLGIPLVVHAHGPSPYFVEDTTEATKLKKILAKFVAKVVANHSNLIVSTDSHTRSLFLPFVDRAPVICVPTPLDTKVYSRPNSSCVEKTLHEDLILGFIGRLSRQKNLCVLLDAYAKARPDLNEKLKLVIAGDGPEKSFLMRKVEQLKVDKNVVFTGKVSDIEKLELLHSFDVFIMPSIYEGCPIALLEAMASSKAIISSNISSIREIVKNNEEAILIDPQDVEGLKQAILLLYNDPTLRFKLGKNAKERTKLYDINIIFEQILRIYESLLRQKK